MGDKTPVNKIYEYIQLKSDSNSNITSGIIKKNLKCLKNVNVYGTIKAPKLDVDEIKYTYQKVNINDDKDLDISGSIDISGTAYGASFSSDVNASGQDIAGVDDVYAVFASKKLVVIGHI